MVIYEVNLNINREIYAEFVLWLKDHVKEMLQYPGFMCANLLKEEQDDGFGQEQLTVQYKLENRKHLENYFTEFAPKMRDKGIKRFNEKFSASRRIFNIEDVIEK